MDTSVLNTYSLCSFDYFFVVDVHLLFNPFTTDPVKALHFAILILSTLFNFWHSCALALSPECQSVRMSKIKKCGLDQYGAEPFEQQQFGTAGIGGLRCIGLYFLHLNVQK